MNDPIHYDIIADIHGRFDKLCSLMARLGYEQIGIGFIPPAGRLRLWRLPGGACLLAPKPFGHSHGREFQE